MTSDTDVGGEASAGENAGQTEAKGYIAAQLADIRTERERLRDRLDVLQARERTLWADARRAGVSFGRIAAVSGVDRATVFYALNPRGSRSDPLPRDRKGSGGDDD